MGDLLLEGAKSQIKSGVCEVVAIVMLIIKLFCWILIISGRVIEDVENGF